MLVSTYFYMYLCDISDGATDWIDEGEPTFCALRPDEIHCYTSFLLLQTFIKLFYCYIYCDNWKLIIAFKMFKDIIKRDKNGQKEQTGITQNTKVNVIWHS